MMSIESCRSRTEEGAAYVEPHDQVAAILTGFSKFGLDQSGTHLQKS